MPTRATQYAIRAEDKVTTLAISEGFSLCSADQVGRRNRFVTIVTT